MQGDYSARVVPDGPYCLVVVLLPARLRWCPKLLVATSLPDPQRRDSEVQRNNPLLCVFRRA